MEIKFSAFRIGITAFYLNSKNVKLTYVNRLFLKILFFEI